MLSSTTRKVKEFIQNFSGKRKRRAILLGNALFLVVAVLISTVSPTQAAPTAPEQGTAGTVPVADKAKMRNVVLYDSEAKPLIDQMRTLMDPQRVVFLKMGGVQDLETWSLTGPGTRWYNSTVTIAMGGSDIASTTPEVYNSTLQRSVNALYIRGISGNVNLVPTAGMLDPENQLYLDSMQAAFDSELFSSLRLLPMSGVSEVKTLGLSLLGTSLSAPTWWEAPPTEYMTKEQKENLGNRPPQQEDNVPKSESNGDATNGQGSGIPTTTAPDFGEDEEGLAPVPAEHGVGVVGVSAGEGAAPLSPLAPVRAQQENPNDDLSGSLTPTQVALVTVYANCKEFNKDSFEGGSFSSEEIRAVMSTCMALQGGLVDLKAPDGVDMAEVYDALGSVADDLIAKGWEPIDLSPTEDKEDSCKGWSICQIGDAASSVKNGVSIGIELAKDIAVSNYEGMADACEWTIVCKGVINEVTEGVNSVSETIQEKINNSPLPAPVKVILTEVTQKTQNLVNVVTPFSNNQQQYVESLSGATGSGASGPSPASFANAVPLRHDLRGACEYLAFCRWDNATDLTMPDVKITNVGSVIGATQIMLGTIFLSISGLIFMILGWGVRQMVDSSFMTSGPALINRIFAAMAVGFFGATPNGNSVDFANNRLIGSLLVIVIAVAVKDLFTFKPVEAVKKVAKAAIVIFFIAVLSVGAYKDEYITWASTEVVNGETKTIPGGNKSEAAMEERANLNNYAWLSPGRAIKTVELGVSQLEGLVGNVATEIVTLNHTLQTETIAGDGSDTCWRYTDAMTNTFRNTAAYTKLAEGPGGVAAGERGGKGEVLVTWDSLYRSLYLDLYRTTRFGSTQSGLNSWCHSAEMSAGSPTGDQVMLLRKAKLLSDGVGTTNPDGGAGTAGKWVDAEGNWIVNESWTRLDPTEVDYLKDNGYIVMQQIVGPVYIDDGGPRESSMWFAACEYPLGGGAATVQSEWAKVIANKTNDYISDDDCQAVLLGNDTAGPGFRPTSATRNWSYNEKKGGFIFNVGATSALTKFDDAPEAFDMYRAYMGQSASTTLIYTIATLLMAAMAAKYLGPVILGAFIAKIIGVAAMSLLLLVLFIMILPFKAGNKLGKMVGMTAIFSAMTTAFFTAVIMVILALITVFNAAFVPQGGGYSWDNAFLMIVVNVGAFFVLKSVLQSLGADLSTFRTAAFSAATLGARPMLQKGMMSGGPNSTRFFGNLLGRQGQLARSQAAGGIYDRLRKAPRSLLDWGANKTVPKNARDAKKDKNKGAPTVGPDGKPIAPTAMPRAGAAPRVSDTGKGKKLTKGLLAASTAGAGALLLGGLLTPAGGAAAALLAAKAMGKSKRGAVVARGIGMRKANARAKMDEAMPLFRKELEKRRGRRGFEVDGDKPTKKAKDILKAATYAVAKTSPKVAAAKRLRSAGVSGLLGSARASIDGASTGSKVASVAALAGMGGAALGAGPLAPALLAGAIGFKLLNKGGMGIGGGEAQTSEEAIKDLRRQVEQEFPQDSPLAAYRQDGVADKDWKAPPMHAMLMARAAAGNPNAARAMNQLVDPFIDMSSVADPSNVMMPPPDVDSGLWTDFIDMQGWRASQVASMGADTMDPSKWSTDRQDQYARVAAFSRQLTPYLHGNGILNPDDLSMAGAASGALHDIGLDRVSEDESISWFN